MSSINTVPDQNTPLVEGPEDQGWEFVSREEEPPSSFYTSNYTSTRPPYLNNTNFSSAQIVGPVSEPRILAADPAHMDMDMGAGAGEEEEEEAEEEATYHPKNYTHSSPSCCNTDSTTPTIKGGDDPLAFPLRGYLSYILTRDYDGAAQPLTRQAVEALNHHTTTHGDVQSWVQERHLLARDDGAVPDLAASMMVFGAPRSRTATVGTGTGTSWSIVSSVRSLHLDRTGETVCATGWQFDDVAAHPAGLCIRDEDLA